MEGNWLIDYLEGRLYRGGERLQAVAKNISDLSKNLKIIPKQHKAYYFFLIAKII